MDAESERMWAKYNRERAAAEAADAAHKARMERLDRRFLWFLLLVVIPLGTVIGSALVIVIGIALADAPTSPTEGYKVPPCPCVQKEVQP